MRTEGLSVSDEDDELDYWEKALAETSNAVKKFKSALKFEEAVEHMLNEKVIDLLAAKALPQETEGSDEEHKEK